MLIIPTPMYSSFHQIQYPWYASIFVVRIELEKTSFVRSKWGDCCGVVQNNVLMEYSPNSENINISKQC